MVDPGVTESTGIESYGKIGLLGMFQNLVETHLHIHLY